MTKAQMERYCFLRNALPELTADELNTLYKAQCTLRRWHEQECGNSNDYASWHIERDESTDCTYRVVTRYSDGNRTRQRIPDLEKGAIKRVRAICEKNGLHYYVQSDPRGCALYIAHKPMTYSDYSTVGIPIYM